ncbi:MAG: transposase, partial [Burkholderiales bacterium]
HEILELSLDGELTPRHLFVLKHIREHIRFLESERQRVSMPIGNRRCLAPYADYWRFLQTLPGLDRIGSALILVEIGTDLSAFDSVRHFASWAALCPGNHESAGKRKTGRIRKGNCLLSVTSCAKPPMPLDEPTVCSVVFTKAWYRARVTRRRLLPSLIKSCVPFTFCSRVAKRIAIPGLITKRSS